MPATKNRSRNTARPTRRRQTRRKPRLEPPASCPSILEGLGIIGLEAIEPVILAALITEEPLLLIGTHGTGKSYLLNRVSHALGLESRHYNASLLNYDDLVGYPLPNSQGQLDYVQTPASIWGAQAVFLDEISRCRPDLQNKLFPIIHERRVQGLKLDRLVYRWSAMNPPLRDDEEDDPQERYHGSEPLDPALADRFAFVIEMPGWDQFTTEQQEQIILRADSDPRDEAGLQLRSLLTSCHSVLDRVRDELSVQVAGYVRIVAAMLAQAGLRLSPRRTAILLRNILAVHAVRLLRFGSGDLNESAWLTVTHSLPHRATELRVDPIKVLSAHREAWSLAKLDQHDPLRIVLLEPDPLRKALQAMQISSISAPDFSTIIADSLASLPNGARHALAAELFESGAAGRLVAAVADECGELYGLLVKPQGVKEQVPARSVRHRVWQSIEQKLAAAPVGDSDTPMLTNLLVALFVSEELSTETDVDTVESAWRSTRDQAKGVTA